MQRKIWISTLKDFGPGSRRVIEINAYEEILVLNLEGKIYAIDNICPHAGAALQRGTIEGTVLDCPLHRWGFDLSTGICTQDPTLCARTYTVAMDTDHLFLSLS
jgi:nitrite reductase/ring-hydroxylating ferredoxin subunit